MQKGGITFQGEHWHGRIAPCPVTAPATKKGREGQWMNSRSTSIAVSCPCCANSLHSTVSARTVRIKLDQVLSDVATGDVHVLPAKRRQHDKILCRGDAQITNEHVRKSPDPA